MDEVRDLTNVRSGPEMRSQKIPLLGVTIITYSSAMGYPAGTGCMVCLGLL